MTRLLFGAAIAIAIACTAMTPPSQVGPIALWSQPESQLVPTGSTILDRHEGEAGQTIEGVDTASVGLLVGSQDSPAAIEAFYEAELKARGWQPAADLEAVGLRIRTTTEVSARSWRKGDFVFRLGVLDITDPIAEGPSEGYASVYRINLVHWPAKPTGS
jgi:hypothetical protein